MKAGCKRYGVGPAVWLLLGWLLAAAAAAADGPPQAPLASDLQRDARLARERRIPILLAVEASHCGYCRLLESDFLVPMLISGDYDDRVLIRRIDIDAAELLTDFDGRRITPQTLAERYGVSFTPTLLFLDAEGRELTERMVGLTTPDFFGGYLDQAIDAALRALRGR
ncbi:thioredoxin family protein [Thiohalobacter sp. IOR34]|uniref:thioredoxin family protein n=1 Tax=Thiohalobacter sp. IOR34 TaxID=3057176 RepID=UPI0025B0D12D|nr:thioredoxin fold domain-containing protein [Thiohalobacter sp. IOR34]WJW75593.1 thioredoxin family protein [Thiohalobacter sp. IOR34]